MLCVGILSDFLFIYFCDLVCWYVDGFRANGLEPGVSLEAASLSLGIEARSVYIPPSPDPINSFAICGIYWVRLLLVVVVVIFNAPTLPYTICNIRF
ncbi:hypothetical protein Hanom_Chr10g00962381 [Helianthus anomalus]